MSTSRAIITVYLSILVMTQVAFAGLIRRDLDTNENDPDQTVLYRTKRGTHHHRGRNVAFQVTRNKPLTASRLDVLKFDQKTTNIGNHYNRHTGEFVAPVRGTYVFNLQIVAGAGTNVEVSIQKTATPSPYSHYVTVVKAESDKTGSQTNYGGQGTATAVLRLEPGQRVTTLVTWISGDRQIIEGDSKTSFSGYLIHSD